MSSRTESSKGWLGTGKGHGGHRTLQEAEARLDGTRLDGEGEPDFVVAAVHVAQALFGVDRDDHLVRAGFRGPPPQTVGASLTGLNRCNEALTGVDFGDRSRSVEHETNVFCGRVAVVEELKPNFEDGACNGARGDEALVVDAGQSGQRQLWRGGKVVHFVGAAEGFADGTGLVDKAHRDVMVAVFDLR